MRNRKNQPTKTYKVAPTELVTPRLSTEWLEEPGLLFANGNVHPDPKTGIPLYGPWSLATARHKREVHVGFIGTSDSVDHAQQFYLKCSNGIDGDDQHAPFPGCRSDIGFRCDLRMDAKLIEQISRHESQRILAIKKGRERFETMLELLQQKLMVLSQRDYPLDYVVLAMPDDLYRRCRVTNYRDKGKVIHRDLRLAFKAMAMQYHKPTQLLLETTTGLTDSRRKLDHESVIAWNLFTGMYFKVDGLPWGPTGLPPASCHVGISFFRPLGESSTLRTSVVQAFDENGEGLVLRGHHFQWDEAKHGKSPHLTAEMADELISMVLERYKKERGQLPQRVVIHKTSRFEPDEQKGFENALSKVERYDLISLCPTSESRLLRAGKYPPLRGTSFKIGDVAFLYTSGYISTLGRYPHGHVPSPLQIADHVGDTPIRQLMQEIMVLTKMNWNSANFSGLWPITLRFSRLVGDVLREVGEREPEPKYKFYM
jgi:hypothetical protein